jgi:hypothetical protein
MKAGYWINYETGKEFPVDEHEQWLRRKGNAKKLGLSKRVIEAFDEFKPVSDRDKFLAFIMQHAPVMRVRGHGNYITFEYSSRRKRGPMDSIWLWGLKGAGAYTGLYIVNFATGEKTSIYWRDFKEAMDAGGADAVMRVATVQEFTWKTKIASELLDLSRILIGEKEAPAWTIK